MHPLARLQKYGTRGVSGPRQHGFWQKVWRKPKKKRKRLGKWLRKQERKWLREHKPVVQIAQTVQTTQTIQAAKPSKELHRLEVFSRRMRNHPTSLERRTRQLLTGLRVSFKEQVIVGPYIVDFVVLGSLAVEVDGPTHDAVEKKAYDSRREEFLKSCGFKILRLHWREFGNLVGVQKKTQQCIESTFNIALAAAWNMAA